jgi:hypothetical protein
MYWLLCCTEYNPDYYYSRDQIKWLTADHNAECNAISVAKLHYREYNSEQDPDHDPAIPSYTTTMTIDDCNLLQNEALLIDVPCEAI